MSFPFNVRVYGILFNKKKELLITEEYRMNTHIIKLPGGGLEFGEGTKECIIREFKEELDLKVTVNSHFYTTDFFQPSAFNPKQQVISIYYTVSAALDPVLPEVPRGQAFEGFQRFEWLSLKEIRPDTFTFPIDKKVGEMLAHHL